MADAVPVAWGTPVNGLRLGVSTDGRTVGLHLRNVGPAPLEVLSHVDAGEVHLDWYTLELRDDQGQPHRLTLLDDRDESGIIFATLAPDEELCHMVDVVAWAARGPNQYHPLPPGHYQLSATYDAPARGDNWTGRIEAGAVEWTLDAPSI